MRKKGPSWRLYISDFKTHYKTTAIRQKDGHIDEWNRLESPKINFYIYDQMIFDKGPKTTQWGKNSLSNKWCQAN